jgi:hydroxycarboxylate dehydrogenase B
MVTIQHVKLRKLTAGIFEKAGALPEEALAVSDALVDANLDGHDSHGILRIPDYVEWMEKGLISKRAECRVVHETSAFALIDGNWGWGQVIGRQAMNIAIQKATSGGVGAVAAQQCGHLGRVGDYPMMAAQKGMAAIMFVNLHGAGRLVAPWGGRERRLSANPIALSVPRSSGEPIVVDISTCAIAAGKVRVALHSKKPLPQNCIIDSEGLSTTDPADFFGPPVGALLPFAAHKGFGLALMADILAGALSGAGCSRPDATRVANGFLVLVLDIRQFRDRQAFDKDVDQLVEYVKSSELAPGFTEILIPGEPEVRERAQRKEAGIPIAEETWRQIVATAKRYSIDIDDAA